MSESAAHTRLPWGQIAPQALAAMRDLERYVAGSGLPRALLELVRIRVSQLNGCGYCLDMHTKDARAAGEDEQRLYLLSAWREALVYTPVERTALEWAEAVARIEGGVPDALYERALAAFGEEGLVALTAATVAIGSWNRWAGALRPSVVGSYRPREPA